MTVISSLFRKAASPAATSDQELSGLPAPPAGPAAGSDGAALARLAAIKTLEAGAALYSLAGLGGGAPESPEIARAAQQRVAQLLDAGAIRFPDLSGAANLPALLSVATFCRDPALLPQAIAAIGDEELLGQLSLTGSSPAIRQLAAARVQEHSKLVQLLKDARGKDKHVYRILKQKRDAINAQQRAELAALEAVNTLCATIEHHIHQPFNSSYALIVEHLVTQWQAVGAKAPAELRARAEQAIERCRQVVTRHQQQIASAAAHAAAIEHAVPERQAVLQALQTLLVAVYAASASEVAAQLAAAAARWIELAELKAPGREEIASFEQLSNAIVALEAFNARHGSVQIQAAALEQGKVAALRRALNHLSLLGERAPRAALEAVAALQAWEQAQAAQAAAAAAALRQVSGLVRKAQSTLAAGHSRQAAGMRRAVEDKLHKLSAVPPQLSTQLHALDQQLGELQDWRSFAVAPKRIELIAQMEALIESGLAPKALAVQIKRLQDEWKLISKGSTEDTQAEWQRFHDAAQKAYEPCREFFAAQARQRAHNLERRAALLERLQAFATAQNWEQADWREVARALRESRLQWRSLQPVERAANKPLHESFDALSADLQSRLNAEYASNAEAKRVLINRAQRLVGMDDSRQAIDEVKRLQLAWNGVGLVAHEQSQPLWEEFRQHCDAVFARRQQQHTEYVAALGANSSRAVGLCEQAEQLLALSGAELIEGAKQLPALRAAFEALGELPRDSARALRGDESRTFYSTDVFRQADVLTAAVLQPGTVGELQEVMRLCARHRSPTVVRGGGASYTDGYLPVKPGTLTLDVSRLTRIEINAEDLYVTVEPGVTWAKLYEAVSARGLRTPMWGPFSGIAATVGGGMSHYAVNYGSGLYGVSAESLLGMDVILASGEMLSTGSGGGTHSLPFFRYYGPDLTGLFVGDAGAFGVKARMTLRLMQKPAGFAASSFGFPTGENCLKALMEIAPLGVVAQNFGLDPRQQKTALTSMASANPLEAAKSVFLSAPNPWDGAVQVMRMGVAGRNFLRNAVYSAHFGTEGLTPAEAKLKLASVRAIAAKYGAEVANSIPVYFNANPFMEITPILGPNGERWKPTHGVLPFSAVLKHHADFEALLVEYRERLGQHRVQLTRMLMFFSTNAFIYEPTFLWEDERSIYHRRVYPAALLPNVPEHPANLEGRALVKELKGRIQELCSRNGASHLQVGKDYPYLASRKPETRALVEGLKHLLDPDRLLNPGALGLPL